IPTTPPTTPPTAQRLASLRSLALFRRRPRWYNRPDMAKRFTLVEAQSLIPEGDRLLRQALDAKGEYQDAEQAIREFTEHVMMMGGVMVDRDRKSTRLNSSHRCISY